MSHSKSQRLFVLLGTENGRTTGCRGVYSSMAALRQGVSEWSEHFPEETLAYEEWEIDYAPEALGWDWCYIAPSSKLEDLAAGGSAYIPAPNEWGKNLVGSEDHALVPEKEIERLHHERQLQSH